MDTNEQNIDRDEQRIAELLGSLRHVDVPGNFDTSVRARIAERRESGTGFAWRPLIAGTAAVALLAIVGYLGFRSLSPRPEPTTAKTITNAPRPSGDAPTAPSNSGPATVAQTSDQTPSVPPAPAPSTGQTLASEKPQAVSPNTPPANTNGGSIDEASRDAQRFTPKGVAPPYRGSGPDNRGVTQDVDVPLKMVLEAVGITASWNGHGWQTASVSQNSVAQKSGVRAGDVIEAINGQAVTEKMGFKGSINARTIRVRRSGTVVDIAFKH